MENNTKAQKKKGLFQKLAEFAFAVYMITLYIFVNKSDTVFISQLIFIVFAGLTTIVILQKHRISIDKNIIIVYIAFTWMLATYFWAENQYLAWGRIKTMWQLFLLIFLVYNLFYEDENHHEYLLKCLYVSGIVLLVYSLYIYGLNEVIKMMSGSRNVRLGGEINQVNIFGMLNATTCMTSFYYLFYRKKFKIFHVAVFALAFLFAMSSGSRKALLIVCIGVLFLTYKKYGIRKVYKVIAFILVLSVVFVSIIQLPIFDTINYRMEQMVKNFSGQDGGDTSSETRRAMIEDGWNIFKERILTGYGANNYRIVSRYRTYSHNNFIEILVNFGLIGFVLYYFIYWNVLRNLWSAKNAADKAVLCIFLVRFMMEIAMVTYYDKIHWILIAFFMIKPSERADEIEGNVEDEIVLEKIEEGYN